MQSLFITATMLGNTYTPPGFANLENLPENSPILVYLRTLKDTLKLTQLVKKLTRWFRDG
jgi:hypothetical protein